VIALVQTPEGPRLRRDAPEPGPPHEALVAVRLAGVCATDLEIAQGYMDFRGVMGHEWVGEVLEAGDPAWIGRRVVGEINAACGTCEVCARGLPTHCPHRTVTGIVGRDGAFAERLRVPVGNLHEVPAGLPDEAAVFTEPLAAACEVLEQVHLRPTHTAVVLGAGRLGQLVARVLALTGAQVTALSRRPEPLGFLPPGVRGVTLDRLPPDLRDAAADVVVDCTGSAEGISLAKRLVRPRGTVVLKTTTRGQRGPSLTGWVLDEVRVVGSRCGPFAPALRLLASGAVDPRPLVTARLPLLQAEEALRLARATGHMKVLIDPRGAVH